MVLLFTDTVSVAVTDPFGPTVRLVGFKLTLGALFVLGDNCVVRVIVPEKPLRLVRVTVDDVDEP